MKHHKAVDILITKAEATQQCAYGTTKAHRSALARRVQARELKRVFPNMYAASEYWDSLQPDERIRHIARTLHNRHPDWVFAGVTILNTNGIFMLAPSLSPQHHEAPTPAVQRSNASSRQAARQNMPMDSR